MQVIIEFARTELQPVQKDLTVNEKLFLDVLTDTCGRWASRTHVGLWQQNLRSLGEGGATARAHARTRGVRKVIAVVSRRTW